MILREVIRRRGFVHLSSGNQLYIFLSIALLLQTGVSGFFFSLSNEATLDCSDHCTCRIRDIDVVMRENRLQHMGFLGNKYRPRPEQEDDLDSQYTDFFGVFGAMVQSVTEVTCLLTNGGTHGVSALLNGIEKKQHTALHVKCRSHEEIIWDVKSWEVDFNIFINSGCRISPAHGSKTITIPMNMWILDIHKGGDDILSLMDIKYSMNTLALSVSECQAGSIPKHWLNKFLISATLVSIQYAGLESFDCNMLFPKPMDTLNLAHNDFVRFPECLLRSKATKVRYLSLAHNLISDLTPLYEVLDDEDVADIKVINLSFNDIRKLEDIRVISSLKVLDMSHNFIREVSDEAFRANTQLETLYLSNNRIHKLGFGAFVKNYGLTKLDLSHNSLEIILAEQIPATPRQLSVDVRNNKFTVPPVQVCLYKELPAKKVSFLSAQNPFICDCNAMPFERCLQGSTELEMDEEETIDAKESMFEDLSELTCHGPHPLSGKLIKDISFTSECIVEDSCPFSCDCILSNDQTLLVNCSARRLLEMPDTIPSYDNTTIVLRLDHNPMQMLSYRSYLKYISELHIHNCLLSSVTPSAIAALHNVRVLTLHNNLLQKLPTSTRNITMNHASNITLHNNRWQCSCDNLWLPRWIIKHRAVLWTPGSILCSYLRKPVEDFTDADVNCSNPNSHLEVILAVCLALASLVSTFSLVIYYRTEINVLIYSKLGIRLGSTLAYGDTFSPYDAFVSYNQDNYRWVVDSLVPRLEKGKKKYRLCLHYRDFPVGESVVENIPWAIHLSRCSILVLSNNFVKKEWCIMELRAAFQRLLLASNKLIVIVTDDIDMNELSEDLHAYLNTHDFLKVGEPHFWRKLELLLPPERPFDLRDKLVEDDTTPVDETMSMLPEKEAYDDGDPHGRKMYMEGGPSPPTRSRMCSRSETQHHHQSE